MNEEQKTELDEVLKTMLEAIGADSVSQVAEEKTEEPVGDIRDSILIAIESHLLNLTARGNMDKDRAKTVKLLAETSTILKAF